MVRRRLEMASVKKEGRFPEAAKASKSEAVEPQVAAVVSKGSPLAQLSGSSTSTDAHVSYSLGKGSTE